MAHSENHRHNFKHRTQHSMTYPHPWRYAQRCMGLKAAFRFFSEHAGGIVGRNAEIALMMARAERIAFERDWEVTWEWDDDCGFGPKDFCRDCQQERCNRQHECLCAVLKDENGNVLDSLSGIWDADNDYRRVIEAELASQAFHTEQKAWGGCIHPISCVDEARTEKVWA